MLESFGITDTGKIRANNEDSYLVAPSLALYAVADGMGGAQAGEHASRLAVDTLRRFIEQAEFLEPDILERAFREANRSVLAAAEANPDLKGMGTTMVAAMPLNGQIQLASVGDSRAYVFRQGILEPATIDQTWVQEVGRRLGLDEAALKTHPMRHVLTMAIGVGADVRVQTNTVVLRADDQLLMCSDGLHGVVEPQALAQILGSGGTLEDRGRMLIEAARANGGPDNITAVLLQET
jgi:PPM family protein phosphatase